MNVNDRILLATDLSARSDRALDRAVTLARRQASRLVVVHVIEPTPGNRYYPRTHSFSTLAAVVRAQLAHDLGDLAQTATIRIEDGEPADVIARIAQEEASTLVVVGVARVERLGRFTLGKTVERLLDRLAIPLLIVTERPRGPYQRVAVATDFTEVSERALMLATKLFPAQPLTVFHAYEPLASYGASNLEAHRDQFRALAETDYVEWLARIRLPPASRMRLRPRIELGEPSRALYDAALDGAFDLVVLGMRARGRISEFFLGSVAKRIVSELPCDALFLRETQRDATASAVPVDFTSMH